MGSALFITGTGTDVGKTALSLAVLLWAGKRGLRAAYFKPVQCGTFAFGDPAAVGGDAEWIRAQTGGTGGMISTHVTYRLRMAASPHLAAEREGVTIEPGRIREAAATLMDGNDLLVLEGAGGPAVPLDRNGATLAGLAAELSLPCLIACAPGLGTLHHTLSTLAYLKSAGAETAGFAFCHREAPATDLVRDNIETLRTLTGLPFFGELAYHEKLSLGQSLSPAEAETWIHPLLPALDAWWKGEHG
ncbi:MAG: ATP-dependent dethiobiotin synthetase BioD [Fibrobacteres bacterium]|nr:ATP-dependent dethiobiotin synthetase BioD [Fibrobacterota bacterium]